MALTISGKKGWMSVAGMYMMLQHVAVQKRMTLEVGNNVPMIVITVQVSFYEDQEARLYDFNNPALQESFSFIPPNNVDYPVAAAYNWIKTNGMPGWTFKTLVDA